MEGVGIIGAIIIGGIAGWLAGKIMRGGGFGVLGNIAVGILGSFAGGFLFNLAGISIAAGLVGSLVTSTVGAVVLLWLVGVLKK